MTRRATTQDHGAPNARAAARAQRRERYLDAAMDVIRDEGPGASMEAIAHAAGVSKPILYRHFGDRDGLMEALADRLARTLTAKIEASLSRPDDPQLVIRYAITDYVETIEEDPGIYRFLTQRIPARGAALSTLVDRVAAVIARTLSDGLRAAGHDSGPARSWAYGIVGLIHLAGDDWVANPTISRTQLIDELTDLLWTGLAGALSTRTTSPPPQA